MELEGIKNPTIKAVARKKDVLNKRKHMDIAAIIIGIFGDRKKGRELWQII